MKNVAVINTVFDGSTGKIASGLHQRLKSEGYNSFFCFGYGKKLSDSSVFRIENRLQRALHAFFTRLFGGQGSYSKHPTKRLIKFLKSKDVDTIYLVSLHGYYLNEKELFDFIKERQLNVVYIMIDEYPYLGKCPYKGDCKNYLTGCGNCPQKHEYPSSLFFDKSKKIFKTNQDEYSGCRKLVFVGPQYVVDEFRTSPLSINKMARVLDEAIDVDLFKPSNPDKLSSALQIDLNKKIVLCVAPLKDGRKGCKYFLDLANRFANNNDFVFIHVGNNQNKRKDITNFIPVGFIHDQHLLAEFYSLADLFVFPSLMDTMPNACLESLACGTPILCFNTSGMPYLTDDATGKYVETGNVDELCTHIQALSKKTKEVSSCCRNYALKRYDRKNYYSKLIEIGNELGKNEGDCYD